MVSIHVLVPAHISKYTHLPKDTDTYILVPSHIREYAHVLGPACIVEYTHLLKDRNVLIQVKSKDPERYFRNQLDKYQESTNNKVN